MLFSSCLKAKGKSNSVSYLCTTATWKVGIGFPVQRLKTKNQSNNKNKKSAYPIRDLYYVQNYFGANSLFTVNFESSDWFKNGDAINIIEVWNAYDIVYVLHYLLMKWHGDFSF